MKKKIYIYMNLLILGIRRLYLNKMSLPHVGFYSYVLDVAANGKWIALG